MKELSSEEILELEERAYEIRKLATQAIVSGQWGHIGGSYSLAEILAVLYWKIGNFDEKDPDFSLRDYVVLSKAHVSPALYAALALRGFFHEERIESYAQLSGLEGHLSGKDTPGVESSGGSLGLGLSFGSGIAQAQKLQERYSQRVYCILGDGELSEGQIWEAAMVAIVDYNKVMAKGFLYEELGEMRLKEKFLSFGWQVLETDGHDVKSLNNTLHCAKYRGEGKPICIVAHTVKGKGVQECEFNYKWHTHGPSWSKANEFVQEMSAFHNTEYVPLKKSRKQPEQGLQFIVEGTKE